MASATTMEYLPEVAVAFCFFPTGLISGNIVFNYRYSEHYSYLYEPQPYRSIEPLLWNIFAAILTAIVLRLLKLRPNGREHFEHFKLLIAGIFLLLLSGLMFVTNTKKGMDLILGSIGQAIVYITGLSYTNIRIEHIRSVRLSSIFLFYFIGCSMGAQNVNDKLTFGLILSVTSSLILMLLLSITTLKPLKRTKYDSSLDEKINCGFYTNTRNQLIEYLQTKHVLGKDLYIGKENHQSAHVYMLAIKLSGPVLIHAIFLTKASGTKLFDGVYLELLQWTACGGVACGIILLFVISSRTLFLLSAFCSPFICAYAFFEMYKYNVKLHLYGPNDGIMLYHCLVFVLGITYIIGDMIILDTTPIPSATTYLTIGYVIEKGIICIVQFGLFLELSKHTSGSRILIIEGITLSILMVIVFFVALFKMPNTYGKSLMEIRITLFWGIRYGYTNATVTPSTVAAVAAGGRAATTAPGAIVTSQNLQSSPTTTPSTVQIIEVPSRPNAVDG